MKKNSNYDDENSEEKLIKDNQKIQNQTKEATQDMEQSERKKKIIKWSVIGGIVTIAVVLAIVLPITLKKKNDDNPKPTPTE